MGGVVKMDNNRFFIDIPGLMELESQKKWLDTLIILENKNKNSNVKVEYLTRYLAQCCFLLSEWDFYSIGNHNDFLFVQKKLIELIKENEKIQDYKFKFIYGYFASLVPYIFTFNHEEEKLIEERAKIELKEIYEKNKNCLIYKFFYLGTNNFKKRSRNKVAIQLKNEINYIFPPKSYVEEYFNSLVYVDE